MKSSLLFIPDISGFTEFVNKTEINHSQHVISELLELIIDSNELDMKISEVEGDAILFYKYQDVPSLHKILSQVREMFLNFHNHLKLFESGRICRCGACRMAINLELKIIVHSGELEFINVKEHKKIFGSDVILVHRLLKNNIEEKEYVLFTKSIFSETGEQGIKVFHNWVNVSSGEIHYDKLGDVKYKYISLKPLLEYVSIPRSIKPFEKIKNPVVKEGYIDKPVNDVYEVVTNFEYRLKWNKRIKDINYEMNKVNRVGTKHRCAIGSQNINIETVSNDFGENMLVYGERIVRARVLKIPLVKEFIIYYILSEEGKGTNIKLEVHYLHYKFFCVFLTPLFKRLMRKNIEKLYIALKHYCENYY